MTGYANTSPLVDGNGNGYPTPYVANLTNAFGGSPSITYQWLPRPGKTYSDASGAGVSINASGAIAMSGGCPVATPNGFYNGGTAGSSSSRVFPLPTPTASNGIVTTWTAAINNAGYQLCSANQNVVDGTWPRSWVVDTSTVGGVATATYDRDVPTPSGRLSLCVRDQ